MDLFLSSCQPSKEFLGLSKARCPNQSTRRADIVACQPMGETSFAAPDVLSFIVSFTSKACSDIMI